VWLLMTSTSSPPPTPPLLYERLLRDITACRLPTRAPRTNPRVVKRKMSNFKRKRGSPPLSSQHLGAFQTTIHILPQDLPAQHTLNRPQPHDATADAPWLVSCLI